jgi:hypothetical protein
LVRPTIYSLIRAVPRAADSDCFRFTQQLQNGIATEQVKKTAAARLVSPAARPFHARARVIAAKVRFIADKLSAAGWWGAIAVLLLGMVSAGLLMFIKTAANATSSNLTSC